ncbi:acetyltransferase [Nocardioides sp. W3-2-3]|nr:acetyltransferase [Nocardioides convexus]
MRAIYAYIDEQEHLAAYLPVLDGEPIGLLQTYDPAVDEIGEWYDRAPGDVGVHLLLAADERRAGRTPEVLAAGFDFVAHLPGCRRLVLEPDLRNAASVALLERLGAERGPLVQPAHQHRGEARAVLLPQPRAGAGDRERRVSPAGLRGPGSTSPRSATAIEPVGLFSVRASAMSQCSPALTRAVSVRATRSTTQYCAMPARR